MCTARCIELLGEPAAPLTADLRRAFAAEEGADEEADDKTDAWLRSQRGRARG